MNEPEGKKHYLLLLNPYIMSDVDEQILSEFSLNFRPSVKVVFATVDPQK
jgi:hypothetical protein